MPVEPTPWDGLAAAGLGPSPVRLPADLDGAGLVRSARFHKVLGLLDGVASGGRIDALESPLTADDRRTIGAAALERHALTVRLEAASAAVLRRLAAVGLDAVVLKGSAWAHAFEADPSWREHRDLDLLVPTGHFAATVEALRAAGYAPSDPRRTVALHHPLTKGVALHHPDGIEVDLHRTLAPPPLTAAVDPAPLWDHVQTLELAGVPTRRLDAEASFVHAAVHLATKLRAGPAAVRDLARIALTRPDPAAVRELAARWRLTALTARAIGTVEARLGVDHDLLAPYLPAHPPPLDRALDHVVRRSWRYRWRALAMTPTIPGWRPKLSWLVTHARPRPAPQGGRAPVAGAPVQGAPPSPPAGAAPACAGPSPPHSGEVTWRRRAGWAMRTTSAGLVAAHVDDPAEVVVAGALAELVWLELDRPATSAALEQRIGVAVPGGLHETLEAMAARGLVVGAVP